ncbi:MAG: S24 family peptidase [Mariprofundaceae bacterium]|nr:S24 family peptidase [Mariprofundaceae bacterium]
MNERLLSSIMSSDLARLQVLQDYFATYKILPSYAGMGTLLGLRSKNSISKLVFRLKQQGFFGTTPQGKLFPTRAFFARNLVGEAPAGFPSPVEEAQEDGISIDDFLVDQPSKTVLVQVHGDSMLGAGIHDGDYVVVKRQDKAQKKQIIVAMIDGEFTIKYFDQDELGYFLRPDNPNYPILRPQDELSVFGLVIGQFRKY